jgi:hypothetical protein
MVEDGQDTANSLGLDGRYANYLRVGHNAFEFLLDFGLFYLGDVKEDFHTRVVTNPLYKRFSGNPEDIDRAIREGIWADREERGNGNTPELGDRNSCMNWTI